MRHGKGSIHKHLVAIGLLSCAGYFTIARFATETYPFSTFPMFAGGSRGSASRIVARLPDGGLREVTEFDHWECDHPPSGDWRACKAMWPFDYSVHLDSESLGDLAKHTGHAPGAEPVEVVRHIWHFRKGGHIESEDCLLASCRATPR